MYKAGVCIRYSRLDLFIIKQWPSPPLVPKPSVQRRKWPGRAFMGIRHTRNYTCWLPESYPFTVACWTRTPLLHFPLIAHIAALLSQKGFIKSWTKGDLQGTNCFSCLSRNQWDFVLWKMYDLVKIASYKSDHKNFHPHTFVHRRANEILATLGQKGLEKCAKSQQAALHSDTLTSVKYMKYWVAVRPIAQFIHIRRPNDRDMDW